MCVVTDSRRGEKYLKRFLCKIINNFEKKLISAEKISALISLFFESFTLDFIWQNELLTKKFYTTKK